MTNAFNSLKPLAGRLPVGLTQALPLALPTAAVGASFGLIAERCWGAGATLAMSGLVWSGTAQFGALSVVSAGGSAAVGVATGLVANARYLPMGFAVAPSLRGPWWRRLLISLTLADASFAIARQSDAGVDPGRIVWAGLPQWLAWVGGTLLGILAGGLVGDSERWGLDAFFPVLYLSLLLPELRCSVGDGGNWLRCRSVQAAGLSALVTLALTPLLPPGLPVLVGASAALLGLIRTPPVATRR